MSVSEADVKKIAHLARLSLAPEDTARYTEELNRILGYVETLKRLNTDAVPPTTELVEPSPWRADEAHLSDASLKEAVFQAAPDAEGGAFLVPQVIGGE